MLLPAHWFVSNIFSSGRGNPALPLSPFSQRASPSLTEKHEEMFVCVLETDRVSTWSSYVSRCSISCHLLSSLPPPNIFFTLPLFPLLLSSLLIHSPSDLLLCLSIFFSTTNLVYFRLSSHLLHFSLRFFLFCLCISPPIPSSSLSRSI